MAWGDGDGMEHRNSTSLTAPGALRNPQQRAQIIGTVAHEFFHGWNVERIRPRSLEPFDLERANMSGELWLAEGFTEYYGPLLLRRAGLISDQETKQTLTALIDLVTNGPGRGVRSAIDMSRMAPFVDAGRPIDRTNWQNSYISYYPFGGAVALALDLSINVSFNPTRAIITDLTADGVVGTRTREALNKNGVRS